MTENDVGTAIIGAAMRIHSALGPGLLESAYETCLLYEIEKLGFSARRQVLIPIRYEALTVDNGYRVDLLIDNQVVIELKAVEAILPVHRSQLLPIEFSRRAYARRDCQNGEWALILGVHRESSATSAVKRFF